MLLLFKDIVSVYLMFFGICCIKVGFEEIRNICKFKDKDLNF